jgi:Zn-dependent peptidase ImmA (M78 family)
MNRKSSKDFQAVERTFRAVCKKHGIKSRSLTKNDFYRICEAEDIGLLNADFDAKTETKSAEQLSKTVLRGMLLTDRKDGKSYVYLKCFFQKKFDRFVAAHELGHYFLKHNLNPAFDGAPAQTRDRLEDEADYFAFLATGLKEAGK